MAPTHVVDMVNFYLMRAPLGPQHDHPTHHQRCRHGDRVEQVLVDQVGEQYAQYNRRQECQQQVTGKAPCLGLAAQAENHFADPAAKLPHHGQDRSQLDDDVESHGPFTAKTDHVGDDDLVAGTGNRQELRQPLYYAQDDCLEGSPKIHHSPGGALLAAGSLFLIY